MDRANHRLFIGCRSRVMAVMNADTGKVVTTLPICALVDAIVFDSETQLIFNSNGEGTIPVIHEDNPDRYSPVETVKTAPRARTIALDPKTHQLFLPTIESEQFEVLVVGKQPTSKILRGKALRRGFVPLIPKCEHLPQE
jgi:hypothetical protein